MSIYDFEKKEILEECTRMIPADIKKWCENEECRIYSIDDYIDMLKGNGCLADELEGRTVEEYKKDLREGKAPEDCESGVYKGCEYVIEYVV